MAQSRLTRRRNYALAFHTGISPLHTGCPRRPLVFLPDCSDIRTSSKRERERGRDRGRKSEREKQRFNALKLKIKIATCSSRQPSRFVTSLLFDRQNCTTPNSSPPEYVSIRASRVIARLIHDIQVSESSSLTEGDLITRKKDLVGLISSKISPIQNPDFCLT